MKYTYNTRIKYTKQFYAMYKKLITSRNIGLSTKSTEQFKNQYKTPTTEQNERLDNDQPMTEYS